MYPLGTLKVAWIENNVQYLSSDMFKPNQLNDAISYGEKKGDYLIMQLDRQEGDNYRWKVMPYGRYREYLGAASLLNESNFYIAPNGQKFTSEEVYHTQLIRIADVFLIGPILIYASTFKTLPTYMRAVLFVIGIATILYNGNNYIKEIK